MAWLRFHQAMLIGEVVPLFHDFLAANPAAAERSEYAHILVDEYQDLNRAEQGVIELMSGAADVCIVGDDDQSIYSFKHAHPDGIRDWMVANPGASDISLDDCRRRRLTAALTGRLPIMRRTKSGSPLLKRLLPGCSDQNPFAHSRRPMVMIFHGRSMSRFHASQLSATMSS